MLRNGGKPRFPSVTSFPSALWRSLRCRNSGASMTHRQNRRAGCVVDAPGCASETELRRQIPGVLVRLVGDVAELGIRGGERDVLVRHVGYEHVAEILLHEHRQVVRLAAVF